MKLILTCALILSSAFGSVLQLRTNPLKNAENQAEVYSFEQQITELLEALREFIPDPLVLQDLELPEGTIDGLELGVSNAEITGLSQYTIDNLSLGLIGMKLDLTLGFNVALNSDYHIAYQDYGVAGNGKVAIDLVDLKLSIYTEVSVLSNPPSIKNTKIAVTLDEKSTLKIDGLLVNDADVSEDVSALVTSLIPYVNTYADTISELISPILESAVNALLGLLQQTTTPNDVSTRSSTPISTVTSTLIETTSPHTPTPDSASSTALSLIVGLFALLALVFNQL